MLGFIPETPWLLAVFLPTWLCSFQLVWRRWGWMKAGSRGKEEGHNLCSPEPWGGVPFERECLCDLGGVPFERECLPDLGHHPALATSGVSPGRRSGSGHFESLDGLRLEVPFSCAVPQDVRQWKPSPPFFSFCATCSLPPFHVSFLLPAGGCIQPSDLVGSQR